MFIHINFTFGISALVQFTVILSSNPLPSLSDQPRSSSSSTCRITATLRRAAPSVTVRRCDCGDSLCLSVSKRLKPLIKSQWLWSTKQFESTIVN